MKDLDFIELRPILKAELSRSNIRFSRVSTDTRSIQSGDLFVALQGPNFDGHDYVQQAIEAGAIGVLVNRVIDNVDCLVVQDTRIALGKMAAFWRKKCAIPVVGITGSNGKTTVKEMVAAITATKYKTLATKGNLNNDIGVPLTLLSIQDEEVAVVEMGANHGGEIAYLTQLVQPTVALLNNAGRAHLAGFGSLRAVAEAKAEIVQGLSKTGVFVFPLESSWTSLWKEMASAFNCVTFGLSADADVYSLGEMKQRVKEGVLLSQFDVQSKQGRMKIQLPLMGAHNRLNALAAIAVCLQLELSVAQIQRGLASLGAVKGRLQLYKTRRANVIDDSYNANPDSVMAAIDVLKNVSGQRFLVLGELAEMGEQGNMMYQEVGQAAQLAGIEHVYVIGQAEQVLLDFNGDGQVFSTQQALLETLQSRLLVGDHVLIKGSRSAAMEKMVEALIAEDRC